MNAQDSFRGGIANLSDILLLSFSKIVIYASLSAKVASNSLKLPLRVVNFTSIGLNLST